MITVYTSQCSMVWSISHCSSGACSFCTELLCPGFASQLPPVLSSGEAHYSLHEAFPLTDFSCAFIRHSVSSNAACLPWSLMCTQCWINTALCIFYSIICLLFILYPVPKQDVREQDGWAPCIFFSFSSLMLFCSITYKVVVPFCFLLQTHFSLASCE